MFFVVFLVPVCVAAERCLRSEGCCARFHVFNRTAMGGYYGWSDGWLLWVAAERCLRSDVAPDSRLQGSVSVCETLMALDTLKRALGQAV